MVASCPHLQYGAGPDGRYGPAAAAAAAAVAPTSDFDTDDDTS